jgi:hypothetical protein
MQNIKDRKKLTIIIVAAVVALAIVAVSVIGIVSMVRGTQSFDYRTANLSNYINISPSLYEKLAVDIVIDGVTEEDIDNYINNLQYVVFRYSRNHLK